MSDRVWLIVTIIINGIAILFLSVITITNSIELKRMNKNMISIIQDMSHNRYKNENQLLMKVKELEWYHNCLSNEVNLIKIQKLERGDE